MSLTLVSYVLRAAIRDKILIALVLAMLVGTSFSIFLGSAAVIEKGQFAGVFAASGLRLAGVAGLVLFAVFYVRRSFESRDIEFLLSRPVSRTQLLLSFSAAFSLLALVTGLAEGACIAMLAPDMLDPGALLWVTSIIVENIIMVNVALFFALFLSSPASCTMACFGFYMLARLMGQLLGIIDTGTTGGLPAATVLARIVEIISAVTPRLDLMGQTSWLIYGPDKGIGYAFLLGQGVIFTALVLVAARIDLARRIF